MTLKCSGISGLRGLAGGSPEAPGTSHGLGVALVVLALLCGSLGAQEPTTRDPVPEAPGTPEKGASEKVRAVVNRDRGTVRLRLDCRSEIGRREVTLFANGTVRLRDGIGKDERIDLGELSPEELQGFEARLAEIDLSEEDEGSRTVVEGPWVEQCRLELLTAADTSRNFGFSKAATRSLSLDRLTRIAEELSGHVRRDAGGELAADYQPLSGDVLIREDGKRFRVVSLTVDGKAAELEQIDEPLVIYVPVGELRAIFLRLERRR